MSEQVKQASCQDGSSTRNSCEGTEFYFTYSLRSFLADILTTMLLETRWLNFAFFRSAARLPHSHCPFIQTVQRGAPPSPASLTANLADVPLADRAATLVDGAVHVDEHSHVQEVVRVGGVGGEAFLAVPPVYAPSRAAA